MGRNSTRKIVGKVADALESNPKNITEISEEINADRKAVKKYLVALTNIENIVEVQNEERSRKFKRKTKPQFVDPVEDIPAYRHFDRVEKSKIQMLKDREKK